MVQRRDYKADLEIDIHNLPGEWERQPQLFIFWAEEHAYAIERRDKAKEQLDHLKAQLDSDIRLNYGEYGFNAKPAEAGIAAAIIQQPNYMEKQAEYVREQTNVNLMLAAKTGMETKRKALENLTSLQIAGFYGANTAPAESKVAHAKDVQNQQREHLTQKRQLL